MKVYFNFLSTSDLITEKIINLKLLIKLSTTIQNQLLLGQTKGKVPWKRSSSSKLRESKIIRKNKNSGFCNIHVWL